MQLLPWLTARVCPGVQVGEGIVYVAAGSSPGHFGTQLANALQVLEQLPNPLMLIYDYVLQFGGTQLLLSWPTACQNIKRCNWPVVAAVSYPKTKFHNILQALQGTRFPPAASGAPHAQ